MSGSDDAMAEVVAAVLASRRYRTMHPPLVLRVARAQAAAASGSPADLVKRTKRALHQIFGAYLPKPPRYDRLLAELQTASTDADARMALRRAMAQHASTRERLDHLEPFYAAIASHVGTPSSVLDVACGLGRSPVARPTSRGVARGPGGGEP